MAMDRIIVMAVVVVAALLLLVTAVSMLRSDEPETVSPQADLEVFLDGGMVRSIDRGTGEEEFSSPDASAVIQWTLNALAEGGLPW